MESTTPHLFISVGEKSGAKIAVQFITDIRQRYPNIKISAVGDSTMQQAGADIIANHQPFAVMGYWDVIKKLPRLYRQMALIKQSLTAHPPNLFIGIDAPDLNLRLARHCRANGIRTVQYVSPQVWMWKSHRLAYISQVINCVWLTFAFEKKLYLQHKIPHRFVGHPAVTNRPPHLPSARATARAKLGIEDSTTVIALLIGSRQAELHQHLPIISEVVAKLKQDNIRFISVSHSPPLAEQISTALPDVTLTDLPTALAAADVGIVKSGTVTLEAALYTLPMVVFYKPSLFNRLVLRHKKFYLPFFALPNILANRFIVPELLGTECRADAIVLAVRRLLNSPSRYNAMRAQLEMVCTQLAAADTTPLAALEEFLPC